MKEKATKTEKVILHRSLLLLRRYFLDYFDLGVSLDLLLPLPFPLLQRYLIHHSDQISGQINARIELLTRQVIVSQMDQASALHKGALHSGGRGW